MSYSYSYKSSSNSGGPGGANYSYQSSNPSGSSSYSYRSSSHGSSATPRLAGDAEFQAAKMQAMMGAPLVGSGGNSSYSYKTVSSSSATPNIIHSGVSTGKSMAEMEAEMSRVQREMESNARPASSGSSSYSVSSQSSSANKPKLITPEGSSSGSTVKKVVTTTTTKTNPHAVRELESIERDFSRLGRTPDNYQDDFDKLKTEILTGEAYKGGDAVIQEPIKTKVREEIIRTSDNQPLLRPVDIGNKNGLHETTTTTTTRRFNSGAGPAVTEEKVTKTISGGLSNQPESIKTETFIPIKTYDNTFDDFHMNRWLDHQDNFDSFGSHDLDGHRMDWQNRLGGIKRDFFSFPTHTDMGSSHIESSRTVSKNPIGKPEFSVQFEMRDFKPENISLSTKHGKLIINAFREEKIGGSTSRREFTRTVDLPDNVQISLMRSVYSRDGVLSITAPIKPPQYDPMPPPISWTGFSSMPTTQEYITSQHSDDFASSPMSSNNRAYKYYSSPFTSDLRTDATPAHTSVAQFSKSDSQNTFSYNISVYGFKPEDISVTLDGRKVKVQGKHVETFAGGRKSHNEFTKMFDLPSNVDPDQVESFIKDGHTLFIVAKLKEDAGESVEYIPVSRKSSK